MKDCVFTWRIEIVYQEAQGWAAFPHNGRLL